MKIAAIFLLIVSAAVALPVESSVNPEEPLSRQRRSPQPGDDKGSVGVDVDRVKGVGTVITADADRNLWKNDNGGRLDAKGRWTQVVDGPQRGSSSHGGSLIYSDGKVSVFGSVDRQKDFGTSVGVGADRNLWRSRDGLSSLDAQGSWSKVVDGPARGKPNYGGFINFSRRF
ncbi:sarcotoxin-2A [Anabrus simplex]|uniref:sarcotoxin-2A n=1 Tax=Anabrus simplex TaxID=316456 RepID=UPI0035A36BD4